MSYFFICDMAHLSRSEKKLTPRMLVHRVCPACGSKLKATFARATYVSDHPVLKSEYHPRAKVPITRLFGTQDRSDSGTTSAPMVMQSTVAVPSFSPPSSPVASFGSSFSPATSPFSSQSLPGSPVVFPMFTNTSVASSPVPTLEQKVSASNAYDEFSSSLHQGNLLVVEAQSQARMYQKLHEANYLFLARDGQFKAYRANTGSFRDDETVPEPGLVKSKTACGNRQGHQVVLGRDEICNGDGSLYFQKGNITYPDYYVKLDNRVFAIELKTPRCAKLSSFLSDYFMQARRFHDSRSVKDELDYRRGIIDGSVDQVILFDLSNITQGDPLKDVYNFVKSSLANQQWFSKNINRFIFAGDREAVIEFKPVLYSEIESAVKLHGKNDGRVVLASGRQVGLSAFFSSTSK
ncbi:hypothetical protein [Pseudomonas sp. St316]|uniref:hypothetical protein n=1 Tax=Pseudomonas sp. St316 TaxID=2678257 RepID=UPI001BB450AB|nr:hypothetical protein [Pseudomonas sp. St316]BBP61599.1 hypothetical protein PHLH4_51890 [Pseudomonas sp. St316]